MAAKTATPSIPRRLASMLYECLLVLALLFVASFAVIGMVGDLRTPGARLLYQAYLGLVTACYFVWFWLHGGQTLPMKTWRFKLVSADGTAPSVKQAVVRFLVALPGIGLFGIGLWWALFDRDQQFLHDRIAKTKLIVPSP
jgi:uncharacterized RDD family membrane protein YckC